ncbi:MAG: ferredoxin [Acidimicrobiales bacterium]|jgi:ferredoxin|nr:ferredoxin [Acidimicrobiales bacterium]
MRITIDRDRCMGSGSCGFYAPATFDLDDALKAVVVDPAGDPAERIRMAAESCPTNAITIEE